MQKGRSDNYAVQWTGVLCITVCTGEERYGQKTKRSTNVRQSNTENSCNGRKCFAHADKKEKFFDSSYKTRSQFLFHSQNWTK